jgi:thiol-disulfide isomerase/thioredoxin
MASAKRPSPNSAGSAKSFLTPGRVALTLIVFGLLAALGVSSCNSGEAPRTANAPANTAAAKNPPARIVPSITTPVSLPSDLRDKQLQTLDGESFKLSDYSKNVLVLNVWATWCGPCRLEMPDLVKISNEYKARGVIVFGLATTYNERNDPAHVKDYLSAQKITYKIIWDDGSLAQPLVQLVQGRSVIPQSFVISRDGQIVKHFQGFSELSTPKLMRQAIEDALNDKGRAQS